MNRLLLSLWLSGAVLFAGSTLVALYSIFGWPWSAPTIEGLARGESQPDRHAASRPDAGNASAANDPPAVRLDNAGAQISKPKPDRPLTSPAELAQGEKPEGEAVERPPSAAGDMGQGAKEWVKVAASGANLRAGPSSSAPRLASHPPGTKMQVLSRGRGWIEVANANGSQRGWMYEKLLEPTESDSSESDGAIAEPQGETVKVAENAAVRAGPSEDAAMLFGFPYGRELRVLSRKPGWVEIMDAGSGQTGWIAEGSLSDATIAASPQRPNRTAPYASAENMQATPLPRDEEFIQGYWNEKPRKRARKARRGNYYARALRRAFGGF